jgi:hypothetical protein
MKNLIVKKELCPDSSNTDGLFSQVAGDANHDYSSTTSFTSDSFLASVAGEIENRLPPIQEDQVKMIFLGIWSLICLIPFLVLL